MRRSGVFAILILMLWLTPLTGPGIALADEALERAVKAAFIYKFAPFVTWPQSVVAGRPQFTICLMGPNRFGDAIDQAVAGMNYDGRPYVVRRVDTLGPDSSCDIAYVANSPSQSAGAALTAVRGAPILTVTDDGAPEGVISFKMQAGHVRFRIDETAADADGLTISSKLLELAVTVRTQKGVIAP
jgi:hypothetical protein